LALLLLTLKFVLFGLTGKLLFKLLLLTKELILTDLDLEGFCETLLRSVLVAVDHYDATIVIEGCCRR
jgi:hypothetical protein